jgi:hypothetical protein
MRTTGSGIARPSASTHAEHPAPLRADPRLLARKARYQDASAPLASDGVARPQMRDNVPVKITMGERIELERMRMKEKP